MTAEHKGRGAPGRARKVVAAHQALADFGAGRRTPRPGVPAAPAGDAAAEIEARLAAAREEGRRQGLEEAARSFAVERQRLEEELAQQLAAAERQWREETGRMLARQLHEGLDEVRRTLGDVLAEVLEPVLEAAARRRAVEEFARLLSRMLVADEGLRVHVCGAAPMLEALRAALGDEVARITTEPVEEGPQLLTHIDNTVMKVALEDWRATFVADEAR